MSVQSFRLFHRLSAALLLAAALVAVAKAQTRQPFSRVAVMVTPDHPDWTYQPGEAVTFRIDVLRDGHQVAGATVKYGIGPEMLPPVTAGDGRRRRDAADGRRRHA